MASLFDYKKEWDDIMENAVDEDGVIESEEALKRLEELELEIPEKVDNSISAIKTWLVKAEALKDDAKKLTERAKQLENRAQWLKQYLDSTLAGSKWESAAGRVSYRKSVSVELADDFIAKHLEDQRFITMEPKVSKAAVKDALKAGELIEGATLVEKQNIQVA